MRSQGLISAVVDALELLFNILMVCGVCICWNQVDSNYTSTAGSKTLPNFIDTHHAVYEYVSKPHGYTQAEKYCEYKFSTLLSEVKEVQDLPENVVQFPIWLKKEKKSEMRPLTALVFEHRTDTKYAKLMTKLPTFHKITVCAHIQWGSTSKDPETVFSYAVENFTNEFQLRGMNDAGFVKFAVIIHGHHSGYSSMFSNDGQWHHICITWQKWNETINLYADGESRTSFRIPASEDIIMGGIFIIGQDQDSYGGTFKEKESFSGNITGLNVWAKVLSKEQIQKLSLCSKVELDFVFKWSTHHLEIEPTLKKMEVNSVCSGDSSRCQILQNRNGETNYTTCWDALPFVCYHEKEVYNLFQKTKSSRDQSFASRVNMISNRSVISENPLTSDVTQFSAPEALACLQAIEVGLEMEESPLDSVDVLGIIQFLKEVADVDMHGSKNTLEDLSQHFVHVTGELLEQHDPDMWSEVAPIIKGPMAILQTVDKMACNFAQLLSDEKKEVFIHHKNIEIAVSQVDLNADGHIYKVHTTERVDEIEILEEDLKKLVEEGHTEVTVVNTWSSLNSFQHLFGDQNHNFIHVDTSISHGGYKHVGTYLGSSVISLTVLSREKEISTSVQYYLWHNEMPEGSDKFRTNPVCVFWDFNIRPEKGGGWSTTGCQIKNTFPEATSCFCNHTTNFAVLLQIYNVQRSAEEEWMLRTLTFIGCGVSLCALVVTFVLFLVVGVPKSERTTVHKNLIFALAAAETLLMFSEMAESNKVACVTVTACLHLFFMAAFAWMLVEGLLLWSKVVAVNMSEDRRMKFYYITGWGLPVIIVSVTLATSFNKYLADAHCWLNVHSDIIWAFVGPVLFILTVNTFVLFRVVMVTISSARRRSKMLTPNCSLEKQIGIQVWATAKPIIVLLPVLGLTWLCGVLVHISVIWAYAFIFLNAFQGLYIFLIYAVYNSEVRNAIQRMKEKKKALSFTNCSQPTNYLSSPRYTTSDIDKPNISPPKSSLSQVPSKNSDNMGHVVSKNPVSIYSILSSDNADVELTSFKASGC
ncbi:adhesion G-protein coupled receptor D2 [Hyla sarda]|uniref:adhesion G-protein coupled receptor D2 n=1 Tax=Hyla sarda TaxID=327740 RepID=UPI0024C3D64D|nr:adhesion G-protein coupled receptor D2 [Hyla sarda]